MLSIKSNILCIILFNDFVNSLVELSDGADNHIATSEKIIRDTIKNLFTIFKISSHTPKLKTFITIHNFFISITLKDCINLREIVKLTHVHNIDKDTLDLISLINDVLNGNEQTFEETDDVSVKTYTQIFIEKLRALKMILGHSSLKSVDKNKLNYYDHFLSNHTKMTGQTVRSKYNVSGNYEYWHPSARRIYRGHRVRIKSFPFMASVQFFNRFQCGGSIIKSDLVITSSSCLQLAWNNRFFRENPAFLSVRVGTDYAELGGESIPVLEVYFHPEYDPKSLRHNLAIMRLTRRIRFSKKTARVKKIDFDRDPAPLSEITERITVLGWGAREATNYLSSRRSNRLALADLDFYPLYECRRIYTKAYVTRHHFCGGFFSKGGGACNRDVGGPGIVKDKLMGVISFGSLQCGAVNAPTVFTKLGYYTDWIEEIMEQDTPHTLSRYDEPPKKKIDYDFTMPTPSTTFTLQPLGKTTTDLPISKTDFLRALTGIKGFKNILSKMFGNDDDDEDDEEDDEES